MSLFYIIYRHFYTMPLLALVMGVIIAGCQKEAVSTPDIQALQPPIITYPPAGSQQTNCVLIRWNNPNNLTQFTLQVATDTFFSSSGSLSLQQTLSATQQALISLNQSGAYFARINGITGEGYTQWSVPVAFTVNATPIYNCTPETMLIAPALISPQQNSILQGSTQTFTWQAVPGATSYYLQIANLPNFTGSLYSNINIALPTRTIQQFSPNTNYYWRVQAINSYYQSAWSETGIFSIAP